MMALHGYLLLVASGVCAEPEPFADWRVEVFGSRPLPASVGRRLDRAELDRLAAGVPVTPYAEMTEGAADTAGGLWVGSPRGLMYLATDRRRWRLFHSRRWLPDDQVLDLALTDDGAVWVATKAGVARIYPHKTTLEQKMAEIHAALRRHHLRNGLVGEIVLQQRGTVKGGYTQPSNDNDGLWTSLYVAAEAFRYATTGAADAKANAWESLEALMFLESLTGISGFVARSFVPGDVGDPAKIYGGEWHRSADGRWWWKGDTSSDELDGHYFAHAIYFDLAADEPQKEQIRAVISRITDHILDHGYYYVGPSGRPTRWGVWAPEKLNGEIAWIGDRGLNSLEILSHLKVAERITGRVRYAQAAKELIDRHSYAINTVEQKIIWPAQAINHSDDELAFLAYYPLLVYERDSRLRAIYRASLERSWDIERPEGSVLFNFIYAAGRQADEWADPARRPPRSFVEPERYDLADCIAWFHDVPIDTILWSVRNGDRRDLNALASDRFHRPQAAAAGETAARSTRSAAEGRVKVLPISERMMFRWNANPYSLDAGGDGRVQFDGTFILLPYWMGRYHRLID
jgi:hypothetical protein